jgi:hypothetical protein
MFMIGYKINWSEFLYKALNFSQFQLFCPINSIIAP